MDILYPVTPLDVFVCSHPKPTLLGEQLPSRRRFHRRRVGGIAGIGDVVAVEIPA